MQLHFYYRLYMNDELIHIFKNSMELSLSFISLVGSGLKSEISALFNSNVEMTCLGIFFYKKACESCDVKKFFIVC